MNKIFNSIKNFDNFEAGLYFLTFQVVALGLIVAFVHIIDLIF